MRLVFAGTPEVALPALDAIAASEHDLVGVVTRPDAPSGRGRKLVASPVAQRAEELGVPILKPDHPRDPDFQDALRALSPDCCPVVAYGALLPQSALDIPPLGWVNLHFSCLPAWRGAAPVQHAVWAGDEVTGATTFRIVKAMDAGPTFGVMTERIRPTDTSGDLLTRLAEGGAGLLVATLDGLATGDITAREQPIDGVSLAPKILVEDAEIDWSRARRGDRPPGPGLHAGPRRVVDVRRRTHQGRTRHPHRPRGGPASAARGAGGREEVDPRRHGQLRGDPRRGQALRQEDDERRRLGARCAGRVGRRPRHP